MEDGSLKDIPQIVYLDFDGESTVYRNNDLNIAIAVDVEDSSMSEEQKQYILAELSARYALEDIVFTTEKPNDTAEYSTIFIGQTDDFEEYGSFAGLAETVDKGNQIKNDDAFVFADLTSDLDSVVSVIDHEIGHIVEGYEHSANSDGIFNYAASYQENSYRDVTNLGTITESSTISGLSSAGEQDLDTYNFTAGFSGLVTLQLEKSNSSTYTARVLDSNGNMIASFGNKAASCNLVKGNMYSITVTKNAENTSVLSYTVKLILDGSSTPTPITYPDLCALSVMPSLDKSIQCTNFDINDTIYVTVGISNESTITSGAAKIKIVAGNIERYVDYSALTGKSYRSVTVSFDAKSLGSGSKTITAYVDYLNQVTESNESNNIASFNITISAFEVASPTGLTVSVTDDNVTWDWNDVYDSSGIEEYEIRYGTNSNLSLYGTTLTSSASWGACYSLSNGTYYWQVRSKNKNGDYSDWVSGTNFTVSYDNRPDFIVDSLFIPSSEYEFDDIIKIRVTIGNTGEYFADTTKLKIQVGNAVRYIDIPAIALNKLYWHREEIEINAADIGGTGEYTVTATIDSDSAVSERSESNNTSTCSITILQTCRPDLQVSAFAVAENSISTADSLTLSFTIQNSGTADALSSAVYVYDGSVYLGKCSISGLAAGASTTQNFTIQPGQLSAGTHSLRVIADGGSLIAESNEDNNQSSVINISVSDRDTEAPSKPANVTFSESNGVIFCDWSDSSDNIGVAGYEFRFLRKSGGAKPDYSSAQVRTVTGSNISLSNLAVGSYYYQIRSYDAAGNYSDWTSTAGTFSVTGISENAPSVPSGLKYEILNNQLVLSWNPTAGANNGGGYEIMLGSLKVGSTPKTITVNTNSCVIENPEKYIFWQIRSFNANGEYSDWSAENSYNTWRRSSDAKSILLVFTTNDNIKAEYSYDGFTHVLTTEPDSYYMDVFSLPQGICEVLSYDGGDPNDNTKNLLVSPDPVTGEPEKFQSVANGNMDLFFGNAKVKWESEYAAQHQGMLGWSGTGELVQLNGKNKILDIFSGSADANILVLTDDANGDALFLDDIYSALPESITKQQARLLQINEIRAGAGDDIIDMTSQRFGYYGSEMTICGGDGNDVIWATGSDNDLFGDAGNDRIVGSTGFDLIVGGAGNDSMHSGGGNDIFAFCENWGIDTVEITDNAYITLWFASGNASNWDAGKRVYRDGSNSVTVIGGANSTIDLKFGNAGGQYSDMVDIGAFESAASEKIFEDKNSGMLA